MKLFFVLPWLSVWSGEVNIKVFLTRLSLFWHVLKVLCAACYCHTDRLHPDRFYLLCILTEQDWERQREREGEKDRGQTGGGGKQGGTSKKKVAGQTHHWLKCTKRKQRRGEKKLRRAEKESGDLQIRGKGWRENFFFSPVLSVWDLSLQKKQVRWAQAAPHGAFAAPLHMQNHSRLTTVMHFLIQWAHPPQKCSIDQNNPLALVSSPAQSLRYWCWLYKMSRSISFTCSAWLVRKVAVVIILLRSCGITPPRVKSCN